MGKNKAVLLDRDGVINNNGGLVWQIDKLEILPNVGEAIKLLNDNGWLVIVLTNQGVISRGWVTEREMDAFNDDISKRIAAVGGKINGWYVCPHHPDSKIPQYRLDCPDRKPNIGMFKKAEKDFNLDLSACWAIGDLPGDIKAGHDAGCKTILVKTGHAGVDPNPKRNYEIKPDYIVDDLHAAAMLITSRKPSPTSDREKGEVTDSKI